MARGLGYRPDVLDHRDYIAADRFGIAVPSALPTITSLEDHVGEVYDQGSTNSCVAWAFVNAIMIAESLAGLEPVLASVLFAYYYGRLAANPKARVVSDSGCRPRDLIQSVFRLGIPDDKHWPWEPGRVFGRKNKRPDVNAHMQAHGRLGGEYARIQGYGEERIKGAMAALADGYVVIHGKSITAEYREGTKDLFDVPHLEDEIVGRHMTCLIGYEPSERGGVKFRDLNSWGESWADEGMGWITDRYLGSPWVSDVYVIRGWERIQRARAAKGATTTVTTVSPAGTTSTT